MQRGGTQPVHVLPDTAESDGQSLTRHPVVVGIAIALVAANLRPALASVGPVLPDIRTDLGLSGAQTAMLVSVPVLCLGVFATIAPRLARRWGMEPVIAMALAAITAGLLLRVVEAEGLLFTGTVLVSAAIAIGNVLLPALIKRDFPHHSGTMMGVYTMALSGSAAVAAALTVPAGDLIGRGWRGALGAWVSLALPAFALGLPCAGGHTPPPSSPTGSPSRTLLREPLAWQVTVFFGLQSLAFYAVLSWLPSIYREHGYSPTAASFVLAVSTFVQIPVTLVIPRILAAARDQRLHAAVCTLFTAAGLLGVLAAPTTAPYRGRVGVDTRKPCRSTWIATTSRGRPHMSPSRITLIFHLRIGIASGS
jgi:CP family cyanate transporter-like MFS transporter